MNIVQIQGYIQFKKGVEVTKREIAEAVEKTEQSVYPYSDKDVPEDWLEKIENYYEIKLPCETYTTARRALGYVDIPYWEGVEHYPLLFNPKCTQVNKDMEIIFGWWNSKIENLRVVAMPSNKMDGGEKGIKQGQILIIDISKTDISVGGEFLYIANDDACINIIDKKLDRVVFKYRNSENEPEEYKFEQLKKAKFKVIGRVIHNECDKR